MYLYLLFCNLSPFLHPVLFHRYQEQPIPFCFCTTPSESITIPPFRLCFSRLKASSFISFIWVHILQAFEFFVCSSVGHLLCMCVFLVECAQSKTQCLDLALLVLDDAISNLMFLAAVFIHATSDGVCLTPWPDSVDLGSTCTPLYCCILACPLQLIISAQ